MRPSGRSTPAILPAPSGLDKPRRPRRIPGAYMRAVLDIILIILQLYTYVIIIVAILSWLVAFNVINIYNDFVRAVWNTLNALTEPLLRPIRAVLPNLGGIDISPIILILIIWLIEDIIQRYIYPNVV
jgi:YggT family protein